MKADEFALSLLLVLALLTLLGGWLFVRFERKKLASDKRRPKPST